MRKNMKKRGALELSVNSIVIMVIAFVVLGLILGFTRTIFKFGTEKTTGIFEATNLDSVPDAQNPLTLPDTVTVKSKDKKTLNVGYYNRNPYSVPNAKFGIYDCQDESGATMEDIANEVSLSVVDVMPRITSAWQTIEGSDSKGYKIILTAEDIVAGRLYICTVIVYNNDAATTPLNDDPLKEQISEDVIHERCADSDTCPVYEAKQIFLQIAA